MLRSITLVCRSTLNAIVVCWIKDHKQMMVWGSARELFIAWTRCSQSGAIGGGAAFGRSGALGRLWIGEFLEQVLARVWKVQGDRKTISAATKVNNFIVETCSQFQVNEAHTSSFFSELFKNYYTTFMFQYFIFN